MSRFFPAAATGIVGLGAENLPSLRIAAPAQFGGPGDQWSPESLLAGAVASCFLLSFRAVARALHLEWVRLDVEVDATLDRKEHVTQFTRVIVHAKLVVPAAANVALCEPVVKMSAAQPESAVA